MFSPREVMYPNYRDTPKRRSILLKLLYFAILVAVAALLACSDPTPTPTKYAGADSNGSAHQHPGPDSNPEAHGDT